MPAVSRESDWNAIAPRCACISYYGIYFVYLYDICYYNLTTPVTGSLLTSTNKLFFILPVSPDLQLALVHLEFWKVHVWNERHALKTEVHEHLNIVFPYVFPWVVTCVNNFSPLHRMCLVCPEHAPYAWHSEDLSRSGSEDRAPLGWAFRVCICFFSCLSTACFFKPILYISVLPNFTLALVWATFFVTQQVVWRSVSPNFSCQWPSFVILQLLAHALRVPLNRWLWDGGHSISCQWEGGQAGVVSWSPNTKQLQNHCGKKWINVLNLPSGK